LTKLIKTHDDDDNDNDIQPLMLKRKMQHDVDTWQHDVDTWLSSMLV